MRSNPEKPIGPWIETRSCYKTVGRPSVALTSLGRSYELSADSLVVECNSSKVVTRVRFPLGAKGFSGSPQKLVKKYKKREYNTAPLLPASMDPNGLLATSPH